MKTRLKKRSLILKGNDVGYYKKYERESILEAYNEQEIIQIFKDTKLDFKIKIIDNDYYKRFVAIIEK